MVSRMAQRTRKRGEEKRKIIHIKHGYATKEGKKKWTWETTLQLLLRLCLLAHLKVTTTHNPRTHHTVNCHSDDSVFVSECFCLLHPIHRAAAAASAVSPCSTILLNNFLIFSHHLLRVHRYSPSLLSSLSCVFPFHRVCLTSLCPSTRATVKLLEIVSTRSQVNMSETESENVKWSFVTRYTHLASDRREDVRVHEDKCEDEDESEHEHDDVSSVTRLQSRSQAHTQTDRHRERHMYILTPTWMRPMLLKCITRRNEIWIEMILFSRLDSFTLLFSVCPCLFNFCHCLLRSLAL